MPVWFDPAYELLCLKLKRKLMLVLTDRCQKSQCIRFLFMGLHSRRPVSARADPCPTQKAPHWARQHQKWTTQQWKNVTWSDELCFLLHSSDLISVTGIIFYSEMISLLSLNFIDCQYNFLARLLQCFSRSLSPTLQCMRIIISLFRDNLVEGVMSAWLVFSINGE